MKLGAQLYTVRNYCKTLEDFSEALKKVANIGYTTVQVSGTCAFEPLWLKEQLQKNGLECVLTHMPLDRIVNETEVISKEHDVYGCNMIGLGSFDFNSDDLGERIRIFEETFHGVTKRLNENGKYFMYHNHDGEFRHYNGKSILQNLSELFLPEEMGFTVDTFWVQAGGGDPAYWIEKFSGRVPCIHLKDFAYGRKMAVIGEGNINFDRVLNAAENAGTQYLLVEQDDCYGEDPFDCLKRSYNNLKALGLE